MGSSAQFYALADRECCLFITLVNECTFDGLRVYPPGSAHISAARVLTWPPVSSIRGRRPTSYGSMTSVFYSLWPVVIVVITHKWTYLSLILF